MQCSGDSSEIWKVINGCTGRKQKQALEVGEIVTDLPQITNVFNTSFKNVGKNIADEIRQEIKTQDTVSAASNRI